MTYPHNPGGLAPRHFWRGDSQGQLPSKPIRVQNTWSVTPTRRCHQTARKHRQARSFDSNSRWVLQLHPVTIALPVDAPDPRMPASVIFRPVVLPSGAESAPNTVLPASAHGVRREGRSLPQVRVFPSKRAANRD